MPPVNITTSKSESEKSSWRSILATVLVIVLAPLVAFLLTTFVFQSYVVDGQSMEQTLHHNDRLIIWKLPHTISRITGNPYVPTRGSIIVLNRPQDVTSTGMSEASEQLIKRVVGVPGDRVVVRDGEVTIYNQANPNGFNPDEAKLYDIEATFSPGDTDLTLRSGQIFVLGDNRGNSLDSPDFGVVRSEDIVGRLALRIFPLNQTRSF